MAMMSINLLFILSIFCTSTWASFQRRTSCGAGQAECGDGARRQCIPLSWVCDGDNDCGNNHDEDPAMCAGRDCPGGRRRCPNGGRCISENWFCDGDNDCGDWSDENVAECPAMTCSSGQVPCPGGRRRCISEQWLCDGDNDCGDNSDEDQQNCQNIAPLTCSSGQVPCPSGRHRCISEHWLCDGDNDCGDNSDEDPQNCQGSGVVQARNCRDALQQCVRPIGMAFMGMSSEQILEKIRNAHLRELCGPVLEVQECASRVLSSEVCQNIASGGEHGRELQMMTAAANTAVNFVCREHVDEMNEHKECLLRPAPGGDQPAIASQVEQRCPFHSGPSSSHCPPPGALSCALEVVSEQCGEQAASDLEALSSKVLEVIDCTKHKRSEKMKKEMYSTLKMMHKAFPSLF